MGTASIGNGKINQGGVDEVILTGVSCPNAGLFSSQNNIDILCYPRIMF